MVTAICNVYINSELKLKLFKETYPRVYSVTDNWLMYFRGEYKKEAEAFVKKIDLNDQAIIFEKLNNDSWGQSVKEMLKHSKYNYIYVFIEDHFLVASLDLFKDVIKEAVDNSLDYFSYSFFNADIDFNTLESSYPEYSNHFAVFDLTINNKTYFKNHYRNFFPYSLVSVSSKAYFRKVLEKELLNNKLLPLVIQRFLGRMHIRYPRNRKLLNCVNKLLNLINVNLTLCTPASPLNMEKSIYEMDEKLLPVKIGIVNQEVFANFDDDNDAKNASLIKRGKYPSRLKAVGISIQITKNQLKQYKIGVNEVVNRQFYLNTSRQTAIYLKYIYVNAGEIMVSSDSEEHKIVSGESIFIYANIPHQIKGIEDSIYSVKLIPNENWEIGNYY